MASPYGTMRSHSLHTPHVVRIIWMSEQYEAQTLPDNTQRSQETSTLPAWSEPAIPISEEPQTHALDRATTCIGHGNIYMFSVFSHTTLLRRCHVFQTHPVVCIPLHHFFDLVLKTHWMGPSNCYVPCRCTVCNVTLRETPGACGLSRVVGGDTALSSSGIWSAGL
jgi:hypothetical protein